MFHDNPFQHVGVEMVQYDGRASHALPEYRALFVGQFFHLVLESLHFLLFSWARCVNSFEHAQGVILSERGVKKSVPEPVQL